MSSPGPFTAMAPMAEGRNFRSSRRVRLGDVTPTGRVRLDAVARYLQDIAGDDVDDAGISGEAAWVVRRASLEVHHRPEYEDRLDLVTWCSGTGAAWAERRTTVSLAARPVIEASSLWVCLDQAALRPKPLDERFFAVYGQAPQSRPVPSRLRLPANPPADPLANPLTNPLANPPTDPLAEPARVTSTPWPLRGADFDVLGHVNNAVAWAALEEQVSRGHPERLIDRAQVEYRAAIELGARLTVVSADQEGVVGVWLIDGSAVTAVTAVAAVLRLSGPEPAAARA
ncbi:MAG: thioesterase [Actinomycetota bacterium]|nr:thioesterase [Actinomycetota bacterium]